MAASKGPTAVHWTLIVFVMLFLISAGVGYSMFSETQRLNADLAKVQGDNSNLTKANVIQDERIEAMKSLLGHGFDEVGLDDDQNPNTVLGAMRAAMATYGGSLAQQTYSATIAKLREELNNVVAERDQLQTVTDQLKTTYLAALEQHYKNLAAIHDQAKAEAEQQLQGRVSEEQEKLAAKDTEISGLDDEKRNLQSGLQKVQDEYARYRKVSTDDIEQYRHQIDIVKEKLDKATKTSFEIPDGEIRWVDNLSKTVWINLGEVDKLPKRTTFSVYAKDNRGVARGAEDIKGAIEITRIIGGHLAEARIIEDALYEPMSPGDPIYTPLWSPGRTESFAFIGTIDLDDDGQTDTELLRDVIASTGANISSIVHDDGTREGGTLDVDTKFLIIGKIPDLSVISKQDEKEKAAKIMGHLQEMRDEARKQGIRVVSLSDFLSYVGYKPQRRLFIPGLIDRPYALKNGAQSTASGESLSTTRVSSGNVSGAYTRSKRIRPSSSSGYRSGATSTSGGY